MENKKILNSFLLITAVTLLSACSQFTTEDPDNPIVSESAEDVSDTETQAEPRTYMAINEDETFETINPTQFETLEELKVGSMIYEGLYRYDEEGQVQEGVIDGDFEQVNDNTIRVKIKSDANWSDGEPVKASDFILSWQSLVNPKNQNYYSDVLNNTVVNAKEISNGELDASELGVQALDDKTIEIKLVDSIGSFESLSTLFAFPALSPLPSHQLSLQEVADFGLKSVEAVTNGPYTIASWTTNWQTWTYSKNYEYWNESEYEPTQISVQVTTSNEEAQFLLENQYLDIANVKSNESLNQSLFLQFNNYRTGLETETPFADERVREAIVKSVNLEDIIESTSLDALSISDTIFPGVSSDTEGSIYDQETANSLIAEYLAENDLEAIELELLYTDSEINSLIATEIQNQVNENLDGVSLNTRELTTAQAKEAVSEQNYDFSLINRGSTETEDELVYINQFMSNNSANNTGFSNEDFDEVIEDISFAKASDQSVLEEAESILIQNYVVAPLYQTGEETLFGEAVQGVNGTRLSPFNDFSSIAFEPGEYTIPKKIEEVEE